ncbi:MAG: hypothetical protein C4K60_10845 [Ideonella sp. MAG2]|nr:MAG: hypothetical protein C4K60_10845 [Ideonella sp. MAG2]
MTIRTTLTALGLALATFGAMAQATTAPAVPPVAGAASKPVDMNAREKHQEKRIEKGMANGEISKQEARRLKMEQRGIDRAQKRAEADGQVTDKERARIDRMQDRAGKDIKRQRHDEQKAKPPVDGGLPKQ